MKIKASAGIWLLVGAVVCVIILVLGLFLIVFPQRNQISDVQTEVDNIDATIQQEQNRLNQLKQYEKDTEQFIRQIDVLEERVPETVELADIFQQIDHAAEEAGLDFYSITPAIPVPMGDYYTVTSNAIFNGRYFNLVEFLNHIERLPRSVKVVFLEISESEEGLPYLQINIIFRAFFTTGQGIEMLVPTAAEGGG